jgi:hypothetical protein
LAASGDLVNRATLTNLVSTNATVYFRDSAATNFNRQFYRAVVRRCGAVGYGLATSAFISAVRMLLA